MNSAILRRALRGNIEHRITKELARHLEDKKFHRWDWEFSRQHKDPSSVELTDRSTIYVTALLTTKRFFEFTFDADGDMRVREVMEWRFNP